MAATRISDGVLTALSTGLEKIPFGSGAGKTVTNPNNLKTWSLAAAWALTDTSTFTGAVLVDETSTGGNTLKFKSAALGVTPVDGKGIWLYNDTPSAAGAQQISGIITQEGMGWATTPVNSQSVKFRNYVLPVQGAVNPTGNWLVQSSINNAAYATAMTLTSDGTLTPNGLIIPSVTPSSLATGNMWFASAQFNIRFASFSAIVLNSTSTLTNTRVLICSGGSQIGESVNLTFVTNRLIGTTLYLTVSAGGTAAGSAPIKMTSGSLMTTAEVGGLEFLTDKFYATITTGAARKEFTLNDAALTSGRMPFVTTNGRLLDDAAFLLDTTNGFTITDKNIVLGTTTGTKIGTATSQKLSFFNATPVVQQSVNTILVNNVTSGGTLSTIANYTDLTIYANDSAAIRNNFFRLSEKVLKIETAVRTLGLVAD